MTTVPILVTGMAQVPFASVDPRTKHLRAQALYYQNIVEYLKQSEIVCDDFVLNHHSFSKYVDR